MNKNVEELRTILKEYNLNEPAYKGLIDIEVLKGVLDEVDRLNNIINEFENELYKFYAYEGYNDEQIKDKIKELKGDGSNGTEKL